MFRITQKPRGILTAVGRPAADGASLQNLMAAITQARAGGSLKSVIEEIARLEAEQHPPCGIKYHTLCHCHACEEEGNAPKCLTCEAETKMVSLTKENVALKTRIDKLEAQVEALSAPLDMNERAKAMSFYWRKEGSVHFGNFVVAEHYFYAGFAAAKRIAT